MKQNKEKRKIKFSHCSLCNPLGLVDYCVCPERQPDGSWKPMTLQSIKDKEKRKIIFTDKEIEVLFVDYTQFIAVDKLYKKQVSGDIKFIEHLMKIEKVRQGILKKLQDYKNL